MLDQVGLAFTGATAIWLSQDKRDEVRRYACLFGLAGQPFWFYTTYTNGQWGIFMLSFVYTWSWYRGFKHYWREQ
jgi:hypothetical protein